eukprot:916307-Amphidinium_carterae.1
MHSPLIAPILPELRKVGTVAYSIVGFTCGCNVCADHDMAGTKGMQAQISIRPQGRFHVDRWRVALERRLGRGTSERSLRVGRNTRSEETCDAAVSTLADFLLRGWTATCAGEDGKTLRESEPQQL